MENVLNANETNKANDLFNSSILCPDLFNELNEVCRQDPKYKGEYLTGNLFTLFGLFASQKLFIRVGNWEELTPKFGMLTVGSSQDGKTQASRLILDPLKEIQNRNNEANDLIIEFENTCKSFLTCEYYLNLDNEDSRIRAREKKASDWNYEHILDEKLGLKYLHFNTKQEKQYSYIASDYNLQTLATLYEKNPKHTILCQNDEYGKTLDNFSNGTSTMDKNEYIINAIDGVNDPVDRKTAKTINSKGNAIVSTCTTHQKFEVFKKTLFESGLGNRLFYIITPVRQLERRIASMSDGNNSINEFKEKIKQKTQDLINTIQSGENHILSINTEESLNLYNSLSNEIFNLYHSDELIETTNEDTKNGMFGRLDMNFQQCILVMFFLNKFWVNSNVTEANYFTLTNEDIKRGALLYKYFLNNMIRIYAKPSQGKLTPKQQKLVDLFSFDEPIVEKEIIARGNEAGKLNSELMQDKAIRNFIKSTVFKEYFELIKMSGIIKYRRVK